MTNSEFTLFSQEQAIETQEQTAEVKPLSEASADELAELIEEFEKYRERLLNDTVEAAKKAKLMKSAVMAQLEPELAQLDATIAALRTQQASLIS